MSKFALVDLSNLFHRARHGAAVDSETKVGLAILIVFRSLRKIYHEMNIDHIVFAVDHGSWRYKYYPAYKSRRKLARLTADPDEQHENAVFLDALDKLVNYFSDHTRCTVLEANEVEGDDFIARWITRHPQDQHIIISADSDFVQLLSQHVSIYDAINQRHILLDRIIDHRGRHLSFSVNPKDGRIKVGPVIEGFNIEPEWWRKALFVKLLRGDTTDSVFAAYPGVRYEGKKCSIRAAWDDRREQGYDWNNLMFQTWDKLIGCNEAGETLTETVRVIDEYKINQRLIDLTMQPADIAATMDRVIDAAIARPAPASVGIAFLRLCAAHDQPALAKEANGHVHYLNASYPKDHNNHVAN